MLNNEVSKVYYARVQGNFSKVCAKVEPNDQPEEEEKKSESAPEEEVKQES